MLRTVRLSEKSPDRYHKPNTICKQRSHQAGLTIALIYVFTFFYATPRTHRCRTTCKKFPDIVVPENRAVKQNQTPKSPACYAWNTFSLNFITLLKLPITENLD